MVLSGSTKLSTAYGVCRGLKVGLKSATNNLTLRNTFFNLCKACQIKKMASIPPSAFSARRIRETQRDMKISNPSKGNEPTKVFNNMFMELSPLKYNSMLMNSIWGRYNRYSPHNVKKVNDAHQYNGDSQQPAATPINNSMISLLSAKLNKVWADFNVPQSH